MSICFIIYLFVYRAQFDSLVQSNGTQRKIANQISVTCTYCSKPVSSNVMAGMNITNNLFIIYEFTHEIKIKYFFIISYVFSPLIKLIKLSEVNNHATKILFKRD